VHYLSVNLATVMGDDQPFLFVVLTAEDFASLGETPTLQSIAACLLRKILATQSKGPYTIGGFCAGGILAYEIASQMRAAGHEVSLLVLLDAPNLAYLDSHDSLANKLSYPGYALKRAARLGLRISWAHLREQLHKRLARMPKSARSEMTVAQAMVKAAVSAYQPKKYEGKVLLLMASERPAHMNLLPGWHSVIPYNLHTQYLDGHRNDLLKEPNVQSVVDAIVSHLTSATDNNSATCCTNTPGSTTRAQMQKSTAIQVRMKDPRNENAGAKSTPMDSMSEEEAEKHLTE
jgi:thioesterase domain-containing protein